MFMIHMPKTFKVGDTADCRINGDPQRVTWRDKNTLVIEPDDVRTIVTSVIEDDLIGFICGDSGENQDDYVTDADPAFGGGFIVARKPPQ
jgi:hypothetical protein